MDDDTPLREPQRSQVRELFARHRDFLAQRARRLLAESGLPAHHADDIVTQTMMTVINKVIAGDITVDGIRNWRGYLSEIAWGTVRTTRREVDRRRADPLPEDVPARASAYEWVSDHLDRQQRLALFDLLPKSLRMLLVLRFEDGLSPGEAAAAVRVSTKKAQSMIAGLARKVELVERGGTPRGTSAAAVTAFARGLIALRNERSGRD